MITIEEVNRLNKGRTQEMEFIKHKSPDGYITLDGQTVITNSLNGRRDTTYVPLYSHQWKNGIKWNNEGDVDFLQHHRP
jgi:hypothetical protein